MSGHGRSGTTAVEGGGAAVAPNNVELARRVLECRCIPLVARLQIAFYCAHPLRLAQFWAKALAYEMEGPPAGTPAREAWLTARGVPRDEWDELAHVADPQGRWPRIFFHRMETPKPAKNRLHLECYVGNPPGATVAERRARVDPEVERLVGLGATVLEVVVEDDYNFVTCQDPEGNEFDVA